MAEPSTELETHPDNYYVREQVFFERSPSVRWGLVFVFTICLMIFLHFREVRVEVLELNSIAPGYIVAQVDFDFFDEEATFILKQEATRDVGKIYFLSEKNVKQKRIEFKTI